MVITYKGKNSFQIQQGDFSIVSNPSSNRFKADIILKTTFCPKDFNNFQINPNEFFSPGEYEVSGVHFNGFQISNSSDKEIKTAFVINLDDAKLVFLDQLSDDKDLSPETSEEISQADILFLKEANENILKIIKKLEPKAVIFGIDSPKDLEKISANLNKHPKAEEKLTIKKKDLENLSKEIYILKSSND
jgi:hypothetical protein